MNETESVVVHKAVEGGSGRLKTVQTASNIVEVSEMLCSQEDQPGTSRSTRQIASELGISERFILWKIAVELNLAAFRCISAQVFSASVKQQRLDRCKKIGQMSYY